MRLVVLAGLACASMALLTSAAEAAVTVNIVQAGVDVTATTTGSLNTSGLTLQGSSGFAAGINATVAAFDSISGSGNFFSGISGPASLGPGNGGGFTIATTGVGDLFGFCGCTQTVRLSSGYVSGSALSAVTTFAGQSFASLGLSPGTYVYGTPSTDTITVNIGIGAAVPEPATWAMMLLGFGAIGLATRRKRTPALARA